jgi:hypothetical protein
MVPLGYPGKKFQKWGSRMNGNLISQSYFQVNPEGSILLHVFQVIFKKYGSRRSPLEIIFRNKFSAWIFSVITSILTAISKGNHVNHSVWVKLLEVSVKNKAPSENLFRDPYLQQIFHGKPERTIFLRTIY